MLKTALAIVASMTLSSAAQATVLYSNNFDDENGSMTALNYNGFNGLTVTGQVDLTRSGDYYQCAGGAGSCVDLAGTPGPGQLTSTAGYSFAAGDRITLSFDLAGNSRNGIFDDFFAGFEFSVQTDVLGITDNFNGIVTNFGDFNAIAIQAPGDIIGTQGFTREFITFTAGNAGFLNFYIGTNRAGDIAPVLDNVSLNISSVPEPATWSMMIVGFGAVGVAYRRRRPRMHSLV